MIKVATIWHEPAMTGYAPKTLYWSKLSEAERNKETEQDAIKEIKALIPQLKKDAQGNVEKVAELVMVVNHKAWRHADFKQNALGLYYSDAYHKLCNWAWNQKWTDNESRYLFDTLD